MVINIQQQVAKILQQHGGLESNIPVFHCYWGLLDKLRAGIEEDAPECIFNPAPLNAPPPLPPQAQDAARLALLRTANRLILQANGGAESNIGFTSDYWFNKNLISAIERQPVA